MERINVVGRMKSSQNREFGLKHEKGHIMVCGTEGRRTEEGEFMRKTIFKEVHIGSTLRIFAISFFIWPALVKYNSHIIKFTNLSV